MPDRTYTDWFPPHIKPVRVGWYPSTADPVTPNGLSPEHALRRHWNGSRWSPPANETDSDDTCRLAIEYESSFSNAIYWAGLTHPHEDSK